MTSRARIAIVAVAAAGLIVAFIVASGSNDDDKKPAAGTSQAPVAAATTGAQAPSTATETDATVESEEPEAPATPVVEVVDAKPKGGVQKLEFSKGDQITFKVQSDTADEIHVHGYDLMKDVEAGGSVTFSFPGTIDGRFEVELEGRGV